MLNKREISSFDYVYIPVHNPNKRRISADGCIYIEEKGISYKRIPKLVILAEKQKAKEELMQYEKEQAIKNQKRPYKRKTIGKKKRGNHA